MERKLRVWTAALALVLFALYLPASAAEEKSEPGTKAAAPKKTEEPEKKDVEEKFVLKEPIVVKLEEVPAFGKEEIGGSTRYRYPRGQYTRCTTEPSKQVKAYPKLKSKKPLYGSVMLDGSYYDPGVGTRFHFVLDESGEQQKPAKPEEDKKKAAAKEKSQAVAKPDRKTAPLLIESFVIPRPPEMNSTYDRLYFDLNGDLDLTNDGVLKPAEEPPFEGLPRQTSYRFFEEMAVSLDYGPPLGKRPFAIVPRVRAYASGRGYVYFVPKTARRGTIRLAGDEYTVYLSQSRIISGRYDRPFVQLELVSAARSSRRRTPLLTPGWLGTVHVIDGQLVTVSATVLGDQLTVAPYGGDLGVLEVGPGGRALTKLGLAGSLVSRTAIVPAGDRMLTRSAEPPRRVQLPVGDYVPSYLNVRYGQLQFACRVLKDSGAGTDQPPKPFDYRIKIRKDKPYVLEFSGKPSVEFSSPSEDETFKPGDTVRLRAMLTEPTQGIMITGLWDCREKTGEAKLHDGTRVVTIPKYAKLTPAIVIRNTKGEEVAQGKMPFG